MASSAELAMSSGSDQPVFPEDNMLDQARVQQSRSEPTGKTATVVENSEDSSEAEEVTQSRSEDHSNDDKPLYGKDKGNALFSEGRYREAVDCWKRTLHSCQYALNKKPYKEGSANDLELKNMAKLLQLNLSMGHLKLGEFEETVMYCNHVLEMEPTNTKALYRKAQAQFQQSDYKGCLKAVSALIEADPSSASARSLKVRAVKAQSQYVMKQKRMIRSMFEAIQDDPRTTGSDAGGQRALRAVYDAGEWLLGVAKVPFESVMRAGRSLLMTCERRCSRGGKKHV